MTNDKCKIREIITGTMEHTQTKPKQSKEKKVLESSPLSKGNKNHINQ